MLSRAHQYGAQCALEHFGIKSASVLGTIKNQLIGDAGSHFVEGLNVFKRGRPLHYKNVFWPAVSKAKGGHWLNWLTRANTAMLPLTAYQAYKAAPEDKPVSTTLGVLGDTLGQGYGFTGFGMLGAPIAGNALRGVGEAVGGLVER